MFIVIELQTNNLGETSTLVTTHTTLAEAESKFHTVLSYAAVSTIPCHAAVLMDETGMCMRQEAYKHEEETDGQE